MITEPAPELTEVEAARFCALHGCELWFDPTDESYCVLLLNDGTIGLHEWVTDRKGGALIQGRLPTVAELKATITAMQMVDIVDDLSTYDNFRKFRRIEEAP